MTPRQTVRRLVSDVLHSRSNKHIWMLTDAELARVGLSESEAKKRGIALVREANG